MFKKNPKFIQGVFEPVNKHKYIGGNNPIFRSSWERKFFRWADLNENVIRWGSENIIIPYTSPFDKRVHRYFVDNFVVMKDNSGQIHKYLIEIKPSTQVARPKESKRKKKKTILYEQKTWAINQVKWEAAQRWADKKGCKFVILTEKELGIKGK